MTIDQPEEPQPMRASDADRDRCAEILRNAFADGRLDHAEMDERLSSVWNAKTHAELDPLIRDLPEGMPADPRSTGAVSRTVHGGDRPAKNVGTGGPPLTSVSVFSGSNRVMRAKQDFARMICVFGGSDLDLRDAMGPGKTIVVNSYNVFGGADIVVDDGTEVRTEMISVMGGDEIRVDQGDGDMGTLILRGVNIFGGLSVRRPNRSELRRRE